MCGVCAGTPDSVDNCVCGGEGTQDAEVIGLRKEILRRDMQLDLCRKTINRFDDYFEYRCCSREDQKYVHNILDEHTKELASILLRRF